MGTLFQERTPAAARHKFALTQRVRGRVAMTFSTSTIGYIHRSDLFNPLT